MIRNRILSGLFALLVALSLGATWAVAQTVSSGALSGTVTDPSGAVVPGAKVTATSVARGNSQETTTNSAGVYTFTLLEPGSYNVNVEATGFQKTSQVVAVSVSAASVANVQLAVATSGTTVTVTEAAPLVQSENGNVSTTLSQQQVSQVPNPGNDLSYVAQLAPGVVMNTQMGYGNFSSYGLPGTSNLFTLNGMDDNDPFLNLNNSGATNLLLGQNEVQEATVVNNGYSGQYGGLAGANVNYITKSGGNQFHGNAIYFWNGSALNAEDFFSNATNSPKAFDNVNQWAASIGGPIKKDKLFFFFNTEGLRVLIPSAPSLVDTPTQGFQNAIIANLNSLGLQNSVPFYQQEFNLFNAAPGVNRAVGGQVPGDDGLGCYSSILGPLVLSPVMLTTTPGLGTTVPCVANYTNSVTNLTHEWQAAGRFDYNIGAKDQMFFRMQYDTGFQATFTDPISTFFNAGSTQPEYQGQILETHSFGPTASNQLLFAGSWYTALFGPADTAASLAAFPATQILGDGSLGANLFAPGVLGGENFVFPQGRNVSQGQVQDDFSKTMGAHTIKFGGKWRRNWISDHDFAGSEATFPELVPITLQDFIAGGIDPVNGLCGVTGGAAPCSEIVSSFPQSLEQPFASYSLQMYVQDEWRLKPNFTVTVALRAEHYSNAICEHLCGATLFEPFDQTDHDPDIPYNDAIQTSRRQAVLNLTPVLLEPRASFAWQPFSGTANGWKSNFVVRGGFGFFADQFPGQAAEGSAFNPPYFNTFTAFNNYISPGETNPTFTPNGNLFADNAATNASFVTGFISGQNLAQIQAANPNFTPPNITTFPGENYYPTYEKWSLGVQKGFGANTSLEVSYIGNHGYHEIVQNGSLNAYAPTSAFPTGFGDLPTAPVDSRFFGVNNITSGGVSNYNGLTTTFQHRFTKWTQGVFQFNYTWSHAFDDISNGGFLPFGSSGVAVQDPYNIRANYGPADYDVRSYINANYVYELPIRKAFGGHGSKYLVDGWQVSGAIFYRTGFPYSVFNSPGDIDSALGAYNYAGAVIAPFLGGALNSCGVNANYTNPSTPCVSTSQFGNVTGFTNGQRNAFYGPGYFNTDFTVMKNTSIPGWEAGKLGIGMQFYNLFNHPNFANPDGNQADTTFGQITGLVSAPTSILGAFLGGNASPRLIQLKAQLTF